MILRVLIAFVAVGIVVLGLVFIPWDKVPLGKSPSLDFFWMLGLLTLVSLLLVFWYFIRQKDSDSLERARTLATFAIVLVGILILWGIFYSALQYIGQPLDDARLTLTPAEQAAMSDDQQAARIQELRTVAQAERGDRIVEIATLAGVIIAPLSTLIGFVAGQAAGSSGQELASNRANDVVSAATQAAQKAREEAIDLAGNMTPDQFKAWKRGG